MKNRIIIIVFFAIFSCAPNNNLEILQESYELKLFNTFENKSPKYEDVKEKILFPIKGVVLTNQSNLLPNAERKYRNGIHEGIDIVVPFMTPVFASLDGIIVVANTEYKDIDIESYNNFLKTTDRMKKTPKDIYNHILLGKHIIIDHGFDYLPGYRTTSTYAHLEKINDKKVGDFIKKGELIGYVGNSGTKYGALNNLLGAHLHWEIHFENENNKYYLGQNISKEDILKLSNKLFEGEGYEKN